MSFGFGVGDFLTVSKLAWTVYKSCKDSVGDFQNISGEVSSLHIVLKETEDLTAECRHNMDTEREAHLLQIGNGCHDVLKELESLLTKYDSLGTQTQRTWDRMRWGVEDIASIRLRLISNTGMLTAFNASITRYAYHPSDNFASTADKCDWKFLTSTT